MLEVNYLRPPPPFAVYVVQIQFNWFTYRATPPIQRTQNEFKIHATRRSEMSFAEEK